MLLKEFQTSRGSDWPLATCVTAGAVVGPVVGALPTGVVAQGALVPHGETPPLAPGATTAIVKEPAGLRGRGSK